MSLRNRGLVKILQFGTNLPRDEITANDIRELYKASWGIELAFMEIEYGLNRVLLHGRATTSRRKRFIQL